MKKQLLILTVLLSLITNAQIIFEKGYYITNDDQKIDCFIKNNDWKYNPSEFDYQLYLGAEIKKASIENVKEFGIDGYSKYIRAKVKTDRSSQKLKQLTYEKNPTLKEEILFLKPLIEGSHSLYEYEDPISQTYFYAKEDGIIETLIYKKYLRSKFEIAENIQFKRQLWNNFKCDSFSQKDIELLEYNREELIKFFAKYHECHNSEFTRYDHDKKRDLFNLSIRPGLNYTSFSIDNSQTDTYDTDFGRRATFRLGIEAEVILPFNKNKWGLLFEPTYQEFKAKSENSRTTAEVNYRSIELPIGLRHYFFLNENNTFFINGICLFDFTNDSFIHFNSVPTFEFVSNINFGFGIGYKYNNRYGIELRYHSNRELLKNYSSWSSDYKTVSFIIGYSFL